jgi:hypothetical protein
MSRTPLLIVVVLLAAAALLGAGWWLGRQEAVAPAAAPQAGAAAAGDVPATTEPAAAGSLPPADAPAGSSAPAVATAAASVAPLPLPAAGAKVAEVFDELLHRARQGDARAACRLAADLQRCRMASMWGGPGGGGRGGRRGGGRGGEWESRIAEIPDEAQRERMIESLAQAQVEREQAQQMCEGVTPMQLAQAFPLQMQAAAARPELRVEAALLPALDRMFPASEVEHWQQYRQTALPWLQQAAAQGDLTAVIALARVYGDDRRPGPPVPPFRDLDAARFVTYATLIERYGVPMPPGAVAAVERARASLDADALRRAEAQADALHRPELAVDAAQREAAMRLSMGSAPDPERCE